jgi:predicted  nucleic acid-binding Zn-ribbon protein
MTPQQILWELHQLDEHRARWKEQWQRDGLSVYRQRCQRWQTSLEEMLQRQSELQTNLDLCTPDQEEAMLTIMLELDELNPQSEPLQQQLQEARQELADAEAEEQERLASLRVRLDEAEQRYLQLGQQLSAEVWAAYQSKGLQQVKGGRCSTCRVELPDHLQRLLRQGEAPVCPTCQVALVLPKS